MQVATTYNLIQDVLFMWCSDVNKARTLKAKAKAMAIPMQRLTMKYEVMKSCFFEYSYKDTSTI